MRDMKRGLRNIMGLAALVVTVVCGCGEKRVNIGEDSSSMAAPEETVAPMAIHFWDSIDFRRDTRCLDTVFMEQRFVDFLAVLSSVSEEDARTAVANLLDKPVAGEGLPSLLWDLADKYLYNPNSPMRNEEIYILFLENIAADENRKDEMRDLASYRLERVNKNRPGDIAADFRFVGRDGQAATLHGSIGKGVTMLLFYDPSCEECSDVIAGLRRTPLQGIERVVAIDIARDRPLWESTAGDMPEHWTVGFALDDIDADETYVVRALPSVYLIGADRRVILKDPPVTGGEL